MFRGICLLGVLSVLHGAPARVVLVAGRPSHSPGQHEFNAGVHLMATWLRQNNVEPVVVTGGWPQDESVFDGARAIVFYMDGGDRHPIIEGTRLQTLDKYMKKGVGMVCLHYAVEIPKEQGGPELLEWIGGYYERPYSQNPHNDVKVTRASPKHPISRGWESFQGLDEWYYKIRFRENDKRLTPILQTLLPQESPNLETIAWAVERADSGRGFGFTGAHFHSNWGTPYFRRMVVNAILWSAKVKVPKNGARCDIREAELQQNLDSKPAPKKK